MFERFDDDARDVMELAVCKAGRFNYEYLGTVHILLGLVKGSGLAIDILKNLNVGLREVRLEVEKVVSSGPDMVTTGELPFTPRAKRVIENSLEEARILNRGLVGSEHILLGLLLDPENVAFQILTNLGLKIEDVRKQVLI
jgi:ATP-dependent Clp protease ATP-binding subunit ClpC